MIVVAIVIQLLKQYTSMINYAMNNLLEQTKLNLDVIELDSKNSIKDNLKHNSWQTKEVKQKHSHNKR